MTVLASEGLVFSRSAQLAEVCSVSESTVPLLPYTPEPLLDSDDTMLWSCACCAVLEVSLPASGVLMVSDAVPACCRLFSKPVAEYTVLLVDAPSEATTADCDDNVTACEVNAAVDVDCPTVGTYGW